MTLTDAQIDELIRRLREDASNVGDQLLEDTVVRGVIREWWEEVFRRVLAEEETRGWICHEAINTEGSCANGEVGTWGQWAGRQFKKDSCPGTHTRLIDGGPA